MNFSGLYLNPRLICKASNFTSLAPTMYYYCLRLVLVLGFVFVDAIELGGRGRGDDVDLVVERDEVGVLPI